MTKTIRIDGKDYQHIWEAPLPSPRESPSLRVTSDDLAEVADTIKIKNRILNGQLEAEKRLADNQLEAHLNTAARLESNAFSNNETLPHYVTPKDIRLLSKLPVESFNI